MTGGKGRANLIGEGDCYQPLLERGTCLGLALIKNLP
jgi:hypothetical protein